MTPSTCKSVLGVFVSVGIAEIPNVVVNVTIQEHTTHTVAVVNVRRAPPAGIPIHTVVVAAEVTTRDNITRADATIRENIICKVVTSTVRRAKFEIFSW